MAKNKYYVVWQGKTPGIYLTWKECEAQIKGQKGAKFKGFENRQAAEKAFGEGGYLEEKGLIPAPVDERAEIRSAARSLSTAWLVDF